MSDPALLATQVSKSYRAGKATLSVLSSVELAVAAGEFVSVQGESGCGKTTLLNILSGIEYPDSGYVKWGSDPIEKLSRDALAAKRGAYLSIVFQSYYLVPEIDTLQNALMGCRIVNGRAGQAQRQAAEELLGKIGLGDRLQQLPSTLSGGERQRVAIARAMLTQPKVILADEPTGNLDEATGNQIIDQLQNLCAESGTALVLVTHNADHAARADRRLVLSRGCIT